jgi:thiol-disulfide isomerase/thioredoxin
MLLIKKSLWVGALALTVCASTALAGNKSLRVGDSLPDLTTFSLEGKLPDELKGKVVLLDFWASWSGPCKESFPVMEVLHQKYAAKGLVVLAVNLDDDAGAMKEFLKSHPASFPIVRDAGKKLVNTASIASMPTSFVIGRDGKVASVHKGFHGKSSARQYVEEIEKLLAANVASK